VPPTSRSESADADLSAFVAVKREQTESSILGPVLVIGAGFIGSAVTSALLARKVAVTVVTRSGNSADVTALVGATRAQVSHQNASSLAKLINEHSHVVLAAGGASPALAHGRAAQTLHTEFQLLELILNTMKFSGRTGLTYLSSGGAVYGNANEIPTPESAQPAPIGDYGFAKLAGEELIQVSGASQGISACILRVANVYGPGQPSAGIQGVIGSAFKAAITDEPMMLVDGGRAIRDFVYIDDVVTAILATIDRPKGVVCMNVGSGTGTAISAALSMVESVTALRIPTKVTEARPFDVRVSILSIAELQLQTGFIPTTLQDGLTLTWTRIRERLVRA
jgi:UDP-glucose 4-epimerase